MRSGLTCGRVGCAGSEGAGSVLVIGPRAGDRQQSVPFTQTHDLGLAQAAGVYLRPLCSIVVLIRRVDRDIPSPTLITPTRCMGRAATPRITRGPWKVYPNGLIRIAVSRPIARLHHLSRSPRELELPLLPESSHVYIHCPPRRSHRCRLESSVCGTGNMTKLQPPLSQAVGYGVVIGLGFLFAYVPWPTRSPRATSTSGMAF